VCACGEAKKKLNQQKEKEKAPKGFLGMKLLHQQLPLVQRYAFKYSKTEKQKQPQDESSSAVREHRNERVYEQKFT
jgi:hypothetical protein